MYSIVLMLAVSNNAAVPAWQKADDILVAKRYGDSGHFQYRHRRGGSHGCCGGCCGGGYYGAGCYGSGGYYGTPISNGNGQAMPRTGGNGYYGREGGELQANDRAIITVHLPAEAKLTIDDEATKSTSEMRTFISPALEQGKEFHYTLKAEFNRDGKMVTKTKQISVRAGQTTDVNLNAEDAGKKAEPKAKSDQGAKAKSGQAAEPKKAEPKTVSGQGAQPKANSDQGAQPKANPDQGASPKANSDQGAQPKANPDQGAQPKANSGQSTEPKP